MADSKHTSPTVGIAIFGLGNMGLVYLKHLILEPRATVYYIVRRDVTAAEKVVQQYDLGHVTHVVAPQDMQIVFDDPRVHGVIVASSTSTHEEIVRGAINAGKAVFCEKPITDNLESTRKLYELAQQKNLLLFCAFQRRFDPSFRHVWQKIRQGDIGNIHMIKSTSKDKEYPEFAYAKGSGGYLFDSGIHDLDQICWMVQDTPVSVYVCGHAHNPGIAQLGDVDTLVIVVKFQNGALATADLSRSGKFGYDQRLEVFGDKGMLTISNPGVTNVTSYYPACNTGSDLMGGYLERYREAYGLEIAHFLNLLQGKETMVVPGEEVVKLMALITACEQSLHSGQPVRL